MKIIIILGTGALLTFPTVDHKIYYTSKPDCFSQGHAILQKMAIYHGPGPNQGWIHKNYNIEIGGWYCR